LSIHNVNLSAERIQAVLERMILNDYQNGYLHLHMIGGSVISGEDEIRSDYLKICKVLNIKNDLSHISISDFNKLINNIKYF